MADRLAREAAERAAEEERALEAEMVDMANQLSLGSEVFKVPRSSFAKLKSVYLYLCKAAEVDKARGASSANAAPAAPFSDFAIRWDSKSKSSDEASLLLTKETRAHIGLKPGGPATKHRVPDAVEGAENFSLTISTPKRSLDLLFADQAAFEMWCQVISFILSHVGGTFVDDYTQDEPQEEEEQAQEEQQE